mmetsp:Transcript_11680/g.28777  ORF Transcript_11680/g.28777 Transcript_11680/m.28777 type:complete len:261 (+) Transcript_11680:66-848(+)
MANPAPYHGRRGAPAAPPSQAPNRNQPPFRHPDRLPQPSRFAPPMMYHARGPPPGPGWGAQPQWPPKSFGPQGRGNRNMFVKRGRGRRANIPRRSRGKRQGNRNWSETSMLVDPWRSLLTEDEKKEIADTSVVDLSNEASSSEQSRKQGQFSGGNVPVHVDAAMLQDPWRNLLTEEEKNVLKDASAASSNSYIGKGENIPEQPHAAAIMQVDSSQQRNSTDLTTADGHVGFATTNLPATQRKRKASGLLELLQKVKPSTS